MANDGKVRIGTELDDSGFTSGLQKLGSLGTSALKGMAVSIGAVAAGISGITKLSIDAYASYEQLVGGVETLFKDSAKVIEQYADAAYKTAGMSANQYMETVTSFSASLLQGLEGDTAAAAEYANKAVVDMSDNANKMGTSISLIQNAYQGFAKQNYTMLDNLKLGYGGTQAEMARLINDSGVLGDTMEVTAETVNQVSFDKIIEAIHVVQTEIGITGTTAKEAASTIEGSVNTMKGAWENLLTALAADDMDVEEYVKKFSDSVITVVDNIAPRLINVLPNIANALSSIISSIGPYIIPLIETLLPQLISGATILVLGLAAEIPSILGILFEAIPEVIESLSSELNKMMPTMMSTGSRILEMIYEGIMQGLPMLAESAFNMMRNFGEYLSENMPLLMQKGLEAVKNITSSLRENAGIIVDGAISLALSLAKGLADSIPMIVENVPTIVSNIANVINDNAPKIFAAAVQIIVTLVSGLLKSIPTIIANVPQIIKAIVDVITAFNWINLGASIIRGIANGIKNMAASFKSTMSGTFKEAMEAAMNAIKGFPARAVQWGKDMISGFVKGITDSIGSIISAVSSVASTVSNYLHFSRPDVGPLREYETWMPDMMQGLAKGITDNVWRIEKAAGGAAMAASSKLKGIGMGTDENGATGQNRGYGGGNIYIYGDVSDPDVVARRIRNEQRYGLAGAK